MDDLGPCIIEIDRYLFRLHSTVKVTKSKNLLCSRHAAWKRKQEIFLVQT
jgi:hypothetical protein